MTLNLPQFFDFIFKNSVSTSILILDRSGKILDVNYGFLKSFGYSRESLIGENFSRLFIEADLKNKLPEKELKSVWDTGSASDNNYLLHNDGSQIWIRGESISTKDENGQHYIVKIIQDIRMEKRLEEELKDENKQKRKIIKDYETFVFITSHDLTSPVNNIEAIITAMEEDHKDSEKWNVFFPLLQRAVKRLRKKIKELSTIAEEQELKEKNAVIRIQKVLNVVLSDLEEEMKISGAELSSNFTSAPTIGFSKKDLKSILQNLLSNAIKFRSPHRKLVITIQTEKAHEDYVLLSVQDNGIGIADEDKQRIFQMYQRAHTQIEGSGVGLGIIKKLVENSGSKMELESKVGEGSIFRLYLKNKI